ncbi:hypothetical protein GCM10011513_35600 [Franconibacter daqui]|nr:hypothetical protein GCM10011513_35600 [Franconibacter daqui]
MESQIARNDNAAGGKRLARRLGSRQSGELALYGLCDRLRHLAVP